MWFRRKNKEIDLEAIGYPGEKTVRTAAQDAIKNVKLEKEKAIALLRDILINPLLYLSDKTFGALARELTKSSKKRQASS